MKWLLKQIQKNYSKDKSSFKNKLNEIKIYENSKTRRLISLLLNFSIRYIFLIYFYIIQIVPCISYNNITILQLHSVEITLKLLGTGNQYIIGDNFYNDFPDKVYLNGNELTSYSGTDREIYINPADVSSETNSIKLEWNNNLNDKLIQ